MLLKTRAIAFFVFVFLLTSLTAQAQEMTPNTPVKISLSTGESKEFTFKGKQGDFWQLNETRDWPVYPDVALFAPDGRELLAEYDGYLRALILPADGNYRLRFTLTKTDSEETKPGPHELTVGYTDIFALARGSARVSSRNVGGYSVEIWLSKDEYVTTLKISKGGDIEAVLIGESSVPFQFADIAADGKSRAEMRAAQLWRTPDKTGDGTPDVAIQFYSGGAHCCNDLHIYELGKAVTKVPTLSTADAGVVPMRRNPGGGLRLRTADMSFAYWNMSYAGSPAPIVILDFQNGQWRPNFAAMKKAAPTDAILKKKASNAKSKLTDAAYKSDDAYFEEAFWGEMLNLIYTGNEEAAWKYFDMVWKDTKPGKQEFREDFTKQLGLSPFWKMILEDRGQ